MVSVESMIPVWVTVPPQAPSALTSAVAGVLTGAVPAAPRATTAWRPAPGRGGTTRVVRLVERGLAGHLVISHLLFVAEEAHHCQRKEIQQSQVCCGGGDGWS